ncbi:MAG: cupin domain-containing protein [Planctomycetota bacterium]|jgi:quercetin dioxygenase-like cupin family protein
MSDRRPIDIDAVKRDWSARGFSCDIWTDPPGQIWAGFVHETDELVMLVEGKVEFEIEGRTARPEPGQEFFIPAGDRHTVRNVGDTTSRWLYGYRSYTVPS